MAALTFSLLSYAISSLASFNLRVILYGVLPSFHSEYIPPLREKLSFSTSDDDPRYSSGNKDSGSWSSSVAIDPFVSSFFSSV